ncbi:unnamed protein product [Durusdinium trenchii]|uniref:Pentatricopeptide repeat-containing protein n=1 Tax=Durusdinium trenchii TaxID=1381693 RepID=A0ABP0RE15_9DINO
MRRRAEQFHAIRCSNCRCHGLFQSFACFIHPQANISGSTLFARELWTGDMDSRSVAQRKLDALLQKVRRETDEKKQLQIWTAEATKIMRAWKSKPQYATSTLFFLASSLRTSALASHTLELMHSYGIARSIVHYTTVISVLGRHSDWQGALDLMLHLPEDVDANIITFNSMISAFSSAQRWTLALQIAGMASTGGVSFDMITRNCCLAACDKGEQWQMAFSQIKGLTTTKLEVDTISCNSSLSSLQSVLFWNCGGCHYAALL